MAGLFILVTSERRLKLLMPMTPHALSTLASSPIPTYRQENMTGNSYPYAALTQHLHGDGDKCAAQGCSGRPVIRLSRWRLCRDCYEKMELSA